MMPRWLKTHLSRYTRLQYWHIGMQLFFVINGFAVAWTERVEAARRIDDATSRKSQERTYA